MLDPRSSILYSELRTYDEIMMEAGMNNYLRRLIFSGMMGILFGVSVPVAFGAVQGELLGFHPYIALTGEYDDNIALTHENSKSDFITSVSPGLKYRTEAGENLFELDYQLALKYYSTHSDLNYVGHQGRLTTRYAFDPRWTFRLNDTLTRSRAGVEYYTVTTASGEEQNLSSLSGTEIYLRNILEPALEYTFGRDRLVGLQYRNMIYRIQEGEGEDSTENAVTARFVYGFDIRNIVTLDYTYSTARFERQPDWTGSAATAGYRYRFNPRTSVFGRYAYTIRNVDEPGVDYRVHSPTVGMEHAFNPNLTGQGQFGWFWQSVETGASFNGPVYSLSLQQRLQKTTFTLAFDGGYREAYFTAENLGFSRYHQGRLAVSHQLSERMNLGLTGIAAREEYHNPDRKDWVWGVTGQFSYQPLKWLKLSFEASHHQRDSDLEEKSYKENRIRLLLTAEY
jgi:hypothetical protein